MISLVLIVKCVHVLLAEGVKNDKYVGLGPELWFGGFNHIKLASESRERAAEIETEKTQSDRSQRGRTSRIF